MVGRGKKNIFGINGRLTLMGGDRYTPISEGISFEDIMQRPDKSLPEDSDNPYSKQMGMNVGYAFSMKYTINQKNVAYHFIIEYLQVRSFHGQTFDLRTHKIVNKYTSLTFPNIAYRIEF